MDKSALRGFTVDKSGPISLRDAQVQVFESGKRFRVLVAGRRFGKTHLALVELLRAACGERRLAWYVAPSYRQAKQIAWDRLKEITRPFWQAIPNETELTIRIRGGGKICVKGADRYDSLRGNGLDFVVVDEYASLRPECWTEALRPALADRKGRALFIGTPRGANHLLDQFEYAKGDPDWAAFQFTTLEGGNVDQQELESAARELDERLFRQEFEASFEGAAAGKVYYAFSRTENVAPCVWTAGYRTAWSIDFNVDPMCSVLAQTIGDKTYVLDEMILHDANTPAACEELLKKTETWRSAGPLHIDMYGDASGHQRRTCGTQTDWGLIREFFDNWKGRFIPSFRTARSNPGVRDRVNVVNSRLCNAVGERRLIVDPKCRELIRDLERVSWQRDGTGRVSEELDKTDRMRTHVSDAMGYYLTEQFSIRPKIGPRNDGRFL